MPIPTITLFAWLGLFLLTAFLGYVLGNWAKLRQLPNLLVSFAVGWVPVLACWAISINWQPTKVEVEILHPESGTEVDSSMIVVEGKVVPSHARVRLIARSEKDVFWWIQPEVHAEGEGRAAGAWKGACHLGTSREGLNENFQLIAIASCENSLIGLLLGLEPPGAGPTKSLPRWTQSRPVVVRRVEK